MIMKRLVVFCILVFVANVRAGDESDDVCTAAQHFAEDAAKRMQSGTSAAREFDMQGGVDGISKALLNIINHVHSYHVNSSITPARVGSLTLAKCQNGAFGKLTYADLPEQYDPAYQEADEDGESATTVPGDAQPLMRPQAAPVATSVSRGAGSSYDCQSYRQRVEALDSQMRAGYSSESGDSMREERRKYRELINSHCK